MVDENGLREEFKCYGLFESDLELIKDLIYREDLKRAEGNQTQIDEIVN
jgi:hypothetical protein